MTLRIHTSSRTLFVVTVLVVLAAPAHGLAEPLTPCGKTKALLVSDSPIPVGPGGISRLHNLDYFATFVGPDASGNAAALGVVTTDLICGSFASPEKIHLYSGSVFTEPYPGLEPDGSTFVIVYVDGTTARLEERTSGGAYTSPVAFQTGVASITMDRIDDSLKRLTITIGDTTNSLYTRTVQTGDSSTWGTRFTTNFGSSAGSTGNNRRAAAAWTGNPDNRNEALMVWPYILGGTGDRHIRYAINSDDNGDTGWGHARTLVSVPGKDLSDPQAFRWGNETRVYFMERDTQGGNTLAYVSSVDYGRTWSAPVNVRIPPVHHEKMTNMTALVLGKSRDGLYPVVLVGGLLPSTQQYDLIAFEQGA